MKLRAVVALLVLLVGGVFVLMAATTPVSTCVNGTGIETRCTTHRSGLVQAVLFAVAGIVLVVVGANRVLAEVRADRT